MNVHEVEREYFRARNEAAVHAQEGDTVAAEAAKVRAERLRTALGADWSPEPRPKHWTKKPAAQPEKRPAAQSSSAQPEKKPAEYLAVDETPMDSPREEPVWVFLLRVKNATASLVPITPGAQYKGFTAERCVKLGEALSTAVKYAVENHQSGNDTDGLIENVMEYLEVSLTKLTGHVVWVLPEDEWRRRRRRGEFQGVPEP